MKRWRRALGVGRWLLGVGLLPAVAAQPADRPADRVVILANADDPDSLRIARHYAEVRGVPAANLIALKLPTAESIAWREFVALLWQPLLAQLVQDGWIDAIPMALTDPVGRRKYAVSGHRIEALVVCRGVPLKIPHDPELFTEVRPFTARPEFRTDAGAVDGELSLLAQPNYPVSAFVPNPLFQNERPTAAELAAVVKVSRLDGPTAADAYALVDLAVAAERNGLAGRAYVDIANRDDLGDPWLDSTAKQLADLGFDTDVDRLPATIPAGARFDAPALYFGWYAGDVTGPFTLPGFRFPPGAIALHIHSYSAATLRSPTQGWTGPFVARGATATVGNVHEPYLQFTHRPQLFVRALAKGATLAEAAYFSLNALSWQAILVGDPLYRPFPREPAPDRVPAPAWTGYAVLRQMRELELRKRPDEALAVGIAAQRVSPSLAVGLALAQRLQAAGDHDGAGNALGFAATVTTLRPDEWALARACARMLESCGRPARALGLWRVLLAVETLPRELRVVWLTEASAAAEAAKDTAQRVLWESELAALRPADVKAP